MIIFSKDGEVTKVTLEGEEFSILKNLLMRVSPETETEAFLFLDIFGSIEEDE